jgi:hypothetical protein
MLIRMKVFFYIRRVSIIFLFTLLFFVCCHPAAEKVSFTLISENNKAVGIAIRGIKMPEHKLSSRLQIELVRPGERTPVLGEYKLNDEEIKFEPLVPLTRNMRYEVFLDENLLKMYFEFSAPMIEGRSLQYITLLRDGGDTLRNTFLDLQPELWNADGTVLTLWLDPGRIKRDLIPNKELGTPLHPNEKYTLHVDSDWQSKEGQSLSKSYWKSFVTKGRDDESPDIHAWQIISPPSETKVALEIHLEEPLDYYLLKETLTVQNSKREVVPGSIEVSSDERILKFVPSIEWTAGTFSIHIEDRLEDLSGNNLHHVFDREINGQVNKRRSDRNSRRFEVK